MYLSEHFTLEQLTTEPIAVRKLVDNIPSEVNIQCLQMLCINVLEPLQAAIGKPLRIISGYRSHMVNIAAGGHKISDHIYGQAVDFTVEGISALDLWKNISLDAYGDIQYDQVIYEFEKWVHISYKPVDIQRKLSLVSVINKLKSVEYIRYTKDMIPTFSKESA